MIPLKAVSLSSSLVFGVRIYFNFFIISFVLLPVVKSINCLYPGGQITPGQCLVSNSGAYKFCQKSDGSVCVTNSGGSNTWCAASATANAQNVLLQGDGNIVAYTTTTYYWASWTNGKAIAYFIIQDDGQVVAYDASGTSWYTCNTASPSCPKTTCTNCKVCNNAPTAIPTAAPSANPTRVPTAAPTRSPTAQPTFTPTSVPTPIPTVVPSAVPSFIPTRPPTGMPTYTPSYTPSATPTGSPTAGPTECPTLVPSFFPSTVPSAVPSWTPSIIPTTTPSFTPSVAPTFVPSVLPTYNPSTTPSCSPSLMPTYTQTSSPTAPPTIPQPSAQPSSSPSQQPSSQPTFQPTSQPSRQPSSQPSTSPSSQPSLRPTSQPTGQPSRQPTSKPSGQPSSQPSRQPSSQPSSSPSGQPTSQPSSQPSNQPSAQPSSQPTRQPSSQPSSSPTMQPTTSPSSQPTVQPSTQPSSQPTSQPSRQPSSQPTSQPTAQPIAFPTGQPSVQPSSQPSSRPSGQPSGRPSQQPTSQPSAQPSRQPTGQPSTQPSSSPTGQPTNQPSSQPSRQPTSQPSSQPTSQPSAVPSSIPTTQPSSQPTRQPTNQPTQQPSSRPTSQPSSQPTGQPSKQPSAQPTSRPTIKPSGQPSTQPISYPTERPSARPSCRPSGQPSLRPTTQPSIRPSTFPSSRPTSQPSSEPSNQPTSWPSGLPSAQPSTQPNSQPSICPTSSPSLNPIDQPSDQPSSQPTVLPSSQPSSHPSVRPTSQPTIKPTTYPSIIPSCEPSGQPSSFPSTQPSGQPTYLPSSIPTNLPSYQPNGIPTSTPSGLPSARPTSQPSVIPSHQPTSDPSSVPSAIPSIRPTSLPTQQPTDAVNLKISPSIASFKQILFLFGQQREFEPPLQDIIPELGDLKNNYLFFGNDQIPSSVSINETEVILLDTGLKYDTSFRSIAYEGDYNDDNRSDLVIGDPLNSRAYVLFGQTNQVFQLNKGLIIHGEKSGDYLGWAVASAGDFNNDGIDDVIVSALLGNKVYVIFGQKIFSFKEIRLSSLYCELGLSIIGDQSIASFGMSITRLGDFNGDDIDDIAISSVGVGITNYVHIVYGSPTTYCSLRISDILSGSGSLLFMTGKSFIGTTISSLGDFNGDGVNDIAVGSIPISGSSISDQVAFIVYGANYSKTVNLANLHHYEGFSITGAGAIVVGTGDLDDDGFDDLMISNYNGWIGQIPSIMIAYPAKYQRNTTVCLPTSAPTTAPTVSETTLHQPTSSPSFTFFPQVQNETTRPVRTGQPSTARSFKPSTIRPTRTPSRIPSMVPSLIPTNTLNPTKQPTRRPTHLPTIRFFLPSSSPSQAPTLSTSNNLPIIIDTGGGYDGSWYHRLIIVNSTDSVLIKGKGSYNVYRISPRPSMTITINNFKTSDKLDLSELTSFHSLSELSYSTIPLVIELPNNQRVVLSSMTNMQLLSERNFIFSVADGSSSKGPNSNLSSRASLRSGWNTSIVVAAASFVGLFGLSFFLCHYTRKTNQRKRIHTEKTFLLPVKASQIEEEDNDNSSSDSTETSDDIDENMDAANLKSWRKLLNPFIVSSKRNYLNKRKRISYLSTHTDIINRLETIPQSPDNSVKSSSEGSVRDSHFFQNLSSSFHSQLSSRDSYQLSPEISDQESIHNDVSQVSSLPPQGEEESSLNSERESYDSDYGVNLY